MCAVFISLAAFTPLLMLEGGISKSRFLRVFSRPLVVFHKACSLIGLYLTLLRNHSGKSSAAQDG